MGVLITKEIRQVWRSFRLPALFLVLAFLSILDPLSTRYMGEILSRLSTGMTIILPPPSAALAMTQFLGDIVEIGLLIIIATTMGSVAGEKSGGVTTFILTKPVSRRTYIATKFAVLAGGLVTCIGTSTLMASLYSRTLIGSLDWGATAWAALSVTLYALYVLSATFAGSMMAGSPLSAGGIGLGAFLFTSIAGALLGNTRIGPYLPSSLSRNIGDFLQSPVSPDFAKALLRPGITALGLSVAYLLWGYRCFARSDLP